jgi:hypothetical protein
MNSSNLPEPDEVEIQLRQQLDAVWTAPLQSAQRAKAMSRLLGMVRQFPGIRRVNHQDYLLALNQTWEWMSRNIDEFQASTDSLERDLVQWINGYLYWRIRDIYHSTSTGQQLMSLDEEVFDRGETYLDLLSATGAIGVNLQTLDEQIAVLQQQADREVATQIEAWIESDPDGQLQNCHPRSRSGCHCQVLSYRMIVRDPPDSFTQIATELNIPYQTLVSRWKRSCLPLLQAQARSFGYDPLNHL